MNYKFNLKDINVTVGNGNALSLGEFNFEVTDLNLMESLQIAKEVPSIIRELKSIFEDVDTRDISDLFPTFVTGAPGADNDGDFGDDVKSHEETPVHLTAPYVDWIKQELLYVVDLNNVKDIQPMINEAGQLLFQLITSERDQVWVTIAPTIATYFKPSLTLGYLGTGDAVQAASPSHYEAAIMTGCIAPKFRTKL